MEPDVIAQIFNSSPCVRLLKMRYAEFFLVFVSVVFEEQRAVEQERLHMLLENRLDELEFVDLDEKNEFSFESNESKAKRLIKEWTEKGFLANYQNEDGEIIYELSSYTYKALDWIFSLKKEEYIGTESKFKTLFSQLKELVEYSNENRQKRLELLIQKKTEIEYQIKRLEMGEEVEVFEDYQIEPRYKSLNKLAKELLSDFKEVDDNFREIIRQIYQRQTNDVLKKELLNYIFSAFAELKNSQQGKSFYAFWEFLLSPELQKEWDDLTDSLFNTLKDRNIDAKDRFLKDLKKHLYDAGSKVVKTNKRMSEKLSQVIRQDENSNSQATRQIFLDIQKLLMTQLQNKEKHTASLGFEEIMINLPLERQLNATPQKEVVYRDVPKNVVVDRNTLEQISKLFNANYVDRKILRNRIDSALQANGQTTIADVIRQNNGLDKGLAELLGYVCLLKEYKVTESIERTQNIVFTEDKLITIPEFIITR